MANKKVSSDIKSSLFKAKIKNHAKIHYLKYPMRVK